MQTVQYNHTQLSSGCSPSFLAWPKWDWAVEHKQVGGILQVFFMSLHCICIEMGMQSPLEKFHLAMSHGRSSVELWHIIDEQCKEGGKNLWSLAFFTSRAALQETVLCICRQLTFFVLGFRIAGDSKCCCNALQGSFRGMGRMFSQLQCIREPYTSTVELCSRCISGVGPRNPWLAGTVTLSEKPRIGLCDPFINVQSSPDEIYGFHISLKIVNTASI